MPGIPDQQGGRVDVGSPIWLFIPVRMPPEPPFVCACGREYRIGCQWEYLHWDGKGSSGQRCCSRECAERLLSEYWSLLVDRTKATTESGTVIER